MRPRVVVLLEGGVVGGIVSEVPMEVLVLDPDVEGCDRVKRIQDWDFEQGRPSEGIVKVFDAPAMEAIVDPEAVKHYFSYF